LAELRALGSCEMTQPMGTVSDGLVVTFPILRPEATMTFSASAWVSEIALGTVSIVSLSIFAI